MIKIKKQLLIVAQIIILIVGSAVYLKHRSVVSTGFKEFQQIPTWQIASIELYECPRGSVALNPSQLSSLSARKIATVTNYSEIARFSKLTKSASIKGWNHFMDQRDFVFKLNKTNDSFTFYGAQIGTDSGDIWVRLDWYSGLIIPHLQQWVDDNCNRNSK